MLDQKIQIVIAYLWFIKLNLHIGNYLGAVKNWVDLQNSGKYEMYIFVADWHSLTGKLSAEQLREQKMVTVAELLAADIDPDKVTFFMQSVSIQLELTTSATKQKGGELYAGWSTREWKPGRALSPPAHSPP